MEDPGFVLIEAAVNNSTIISSDCKSGPKEILDRGKGGFLFISNDILSLKSSYEEFKDLPKIKFSRNIIQKKHNIIQNFTL